VSGATIQHSFGPPSPPLAPITAFVCSFSIVLTRRALREFLDQDQMDRYDAFTTAVIPPIAVKRVRRRLCFPIRWLTHRSIGKSTTSG